MPFCTRMRWASVHFSSMCVPLGLAINFLDALLINDYIIEVAWLLDMINTQSIIYPNWAYKQTREIKRLYVNTLISIINISLSFTLLHVVIGKFEVDILTNNAKLI